MMYLLDTNVISEMVKRSPSQKVLTWLSSIDINNFCLSVLTLGEIRKGVERLSDSSQKQKIIQWLEIDLPKRFIGRFIAIDERVAEKWGFISSKISIPAIDALLAASAIVHNLKLVTRNTKDFAAISGLEKINPWEFNE